MSPVQTRSRSHRTDMNSDDEDLLPPNMSKTTTIASSTAMPSLSTWQNLRGDRQSVALLMFLYVLQGIPLGLAASIPYLLSSRHVHYHDQAIFSFVYWPFSIKLLWAPIVDSVYYSKFGRRKSWLVPVQFMMGAFMLVLSYYITDLLGDNESTNPDKSAPVHIMTLTVIFFALNFLAATQDIAVDGWALTMLSRRNVNWASTCNTVGQTAGYFMGNVVFLALESSDFCNSYLRSNPQPEGLVTLSGFLFFWGLTFFVTTFVIAIMKHEAREVPEDEQGLVDTYRQLLRLMRLPAVMSLILVLLTAKIGFSAADTITGLKLIEVGVKKEKLAMLGVPMVPIQIILPLIISKYTTGVKSLTVFVYAIPFRLMMGLVFAVVVWYTPHLQNADDTFPIYYYIGLFFVYAIHQVFLYSMFVSLMAFFANISDPTIGGTYMTLLTTVSNLGGSWPGTAALWFCETLTSIRCIKDDKDLGFGCHSPQEIKTCTEKEGFCTTAYDGYYIESAICFLIGWIWLFAFSKRIHRLQSLPRTDWHCS